MTAQVFNSGQAPTFYVSQALTPAPGGGIDGTFRDVTATRALFVNNEAFIASQSAANPTLVLQGAAASARAGLEVSVVGSGLRGVVKADVTVSPAAFTTGSAAATDYILQSGGAERLRIRSTGIAPDLTAVNLLGVGGDTVVKTRPIDSGSFVSTWTTISGWATAPPLNNIVWTRNGNVVTCNASFGSATPSAGVNQATFTLPVPRSVAFSGTSTEGSGVGSFVQNTAATFGTAYVVGTIGSTTTATVVVLYGGAPVAGFTRVSFSYTLQ